LGLILARCILALGLVLAGLALPLARYGLLLSATALRRRCATTLATALRRRPAAALRTTGGKPAARSAAATGKSAATVATAASTSCAPRIHIANDAQHENARNECRPDTTP
jgi:hypothetical protein